MMIERIKNYTVIHCEEARLDASKAPSFIKDVFKNIDKLEYLDQTVIFDLKQVEFVDSSGLSAIVLIFQKLRTKNKLLLCGIREQVERLLKTTQLDTIFQWYQDIPSAMQAA